MSCFQRSHLCGKSLRDAARSHATSEREATAELLADLAEIEACRHHLEWGFGSMLAYCVEELKLSEQSAYNRIQVARVARHFPVIFEMVADGRHNLTSIRLLTPRLTPETVDDLLEASANRTSIEIRHLLAQRFPQPWAEMSNSLVSKRVGGGSDLKPIAPEVYEFKTVFGQSTHDKLLYFRDLLSHQIPSGDMAAVLDKALEIAIRVTEKRKFAASDQPRTGPAATAADPRQIPAAVLEAVWKRDEGRCTYVGPDGRRCGSPWQLEFDHREAVANGGEATVDNVRILCRAHNQYMAECTFGAGFMAEKRRAAMEARAAAAAPAPAPSSELSQDHRDLISGLRSLGYTSEQAREAAARVADMPDATLEQKFKTALSRPKPRAA